MGQILTRFWEWLFLVKLEGKVLMLGLDGSGKTTILYQLKLGEVIHTIPTVGFNVENLEFGKIMFTVWDLGGQERIRKLWPTYYTNTKLIIFVVDSNDRARLPESKSELQQLLSRDEFRDTPLLVFANKQDLPEAMSISDLSESLDLPSLRNRTWLIQGSSAILGQGLQEGFTWLCRTFSNK
jgi:ADP-ribosylation factor protein 1